VVTERGLIDQLGAWIEELARKWERYVSRDPHVPVPPERERAALERRLRELSRNEPVIASDRFRLEQLLHRFTTYNQLWQRQLRERETAAGELPTVAPTTAPSPQANAAGPASVAGSDVIDVEALHARYVERLRAHGRNGEMSFERFSLALDRERRRLEVKGGAIEGFEIVEEAGAVRLRARLRRRRSE
jgi:hypothetical protein